MGSVTSLLIVRLHSHLIYSQTDLPIWPDYLLRHALPTACLTYPPASPHRSNGLRWYWNLNQLSIAYGFRPRLRSRLTLSGRAFLRNPWVFGGQDSHLSFRYSYRHSHFCTLHSSSRHCFYAVQNAPLPLLESFAHPSDEFSSQSCSTSRLA